MSNVMLQIQFLYSEDCPSHEPALARLRQVLAEETISARLEIIQIETEEQAQRWRFIGSPTILINNQDIVPRLSNETYALTCRAYTLENGRISPLPSAEMIRRALHAALNVSV